MLNALLHPYSRRTDIAVPEGRSDAQVVEQLAQELRELGATNDHSAVLYTDPAAGERRLTLLGTKNNRFGFDADRDLLAIGWMSTLLRDETRPQTENEFTGILVHPYLESHVTWDVGRPTSLLDTQDAELLARVWPQGQEVQVLLCGLLPRASKASSGLMVGDDAALSQVRHWALLVNGHLAGITEDPSVVDRVRQDTVTNLDDFSLDITQLHIPVSETIDTADVIDVLSDTELLNIDVLGVDSGQMMMIDATAHDDYESNEPTFTGEDDTLSYSGACSTTTRRGSYGGVLVNIEGHPKAGVSSSGYGDGAYPFYVGKETDFVLVGFLGHETLDIDGEDEDDYFEIPLWQSTETLVANAAQLTWLDGGTFVVEDGSDGGADIIAGDPCYMENHQDLMNIAAVHSGGYQLALGVYNYGTIGNNNWDGDRVSVMLAYKIA